MKNINIKICCRDMIQAINTKIIVVHDTQFCLGNTEFKLKEPTKEHDKVIVLLHFCPWCGFILKKTTDMIKEGMAQADKEGGNNSEEKFDKKDKDNVIDAESN